MYAYFADDKVASSIRLFSRRIVTSTAYSYKLHCRCDDGALQSYSGLSIYCPYCLAGVDPDHENVRGTVEIALHADPVAILYTLDELMLHKPPP